MISNTDKYVKTSEKKYLDINYEEIPSKSLNALNTLVNFTKVICKGISHENANLLFEKQKQRFQNLEQTNTLVSKGSFNLDEGGSQSMYILFWTKSSRNIRQKLMVCCNFVVHFGKYISFSRSFECTIRRPPRKFESPIQFLEGAKGAVSNLIKSETVIPIISEQIFGANGSRIVFNMYNRCSFPYMDYSSEMSKFKDCILNLPVAVKRINETCTYVLAEWLKTENLTRDRLFYERPDLLLKFSKITQQGI